MNYFVHLTNNAVQVKSESYGSIVKGNIIGITNFENLLCKMQADNPKQKIAVPTGSIMAQIQSLIKLTFDSTHNLLNPIKRDKCFELFGFDFMMDENQKLWLIECNTIPSLGESNEFLTKFFSRLLGIHVPLTARRHVQDYT